MIWAALVAAAVLGGFVFWPVWARFIDWLTASDEPSATQPPPPALIDVDAIDWAEATKRVRAELIRMQKREGGTTGIR